MRLRPRWPVLGAAVVPRPRAIKAITDRQLGRVTIALGAVGIALAGLAVYTSLPANAIQASVGLTRTVQTLMPQGWGFFTASPLTVYPQAFERSADGDWVNQGGSLAVPSDLFGLDRSRRALGAEIALLIQYIPGHDWRTCGQVPTRCLDRVPVAAHLVNTSTLDNLCGNVGFVRQQVLPWAWRGTRTVMPSLVVRAEVSCPPSS
jgi:antimicrobial peptide system SdpA family protein